MIRYYIKEDGYAVGLRTGKSEAIKAMYGLIEASGYKAGKFDRERLRVVAIKTGEQNKTYELEQQKGER